MAGREEKTGQNLSGAYTEAQQAGKHTAVCTQVSSDYQRRSQVTLHFSAGQRNELVFQLGAQQRGEQQIFSGEG